MLLHLKSSSYTLFSDDTFGVKDIKFDFMVCNFSMISR